VKVLTNYCADLSRLARPRAQLADAICQSGVATTTPCYDLFALALALNGAPAGAAQPLPPPPPVS
jgi:hypothetical protein